MGVLVSTTNASATAVSASLLATSTSLFARASFPTEATDRPAAAVTRVSTESTSARASPFPNLTSGTYANISPCAGINRAHAPFSQRRCPLRRLLLVLAALALAGCGLRILEGPEAVSPPDGATLSCTPPSFGQVRFSWTEWGGPYTLTVMDQSGAPVTAVDTQTASAQVNLECGKSYTWRVTTRGGAGRSSPTYRFSIAPPPDGTVQLISPENNAQVECMGPDQGTVQFDWADVQGASGYTIEVRRQSDGALVTSRQVSSSQVQLQVPCRPELGMSYRWRVAAQVPGGTAWSPEWTFSMTLEQLFLISPQDGAQVAVAPANCNGVNTVTFSWTAVKDATAYTLQVWRSGVLAASTVTNQNTTSAQLNWTATSCGTYTWQVSATRSGSRPPVQSAVWSFTTVPAGSVLRK